MKVIQIKPYDKLYNQLQEKRHDYVWHYFKLNKPRNFLEEENKSVSLALLCKKNIIGSVMLTPKNNRIIRFRMVFIIPLYQKKGLGEKLIYEAEKKAKRMSFKEIRLISPEENLPFYLKMGYSRNGDWWQNKKTNLKTIQLKKYIKHKILLDSLVKICHTILGFKLKTRFRRRRTWK